MKDNNLIFQRIITIPKTTLKKAKAFKHKDGSDNSQFHWSNFENILLANASNTLKSSEIKINEYKLSKDQNDYEIRDELGGEKAMCISSYDEALIVFNYIMINKKYYDGTINIVYVMHKSILYYVRCIWDGDEWDCDMNRANWNTWEAGRRIFSFATIESES